MDKQQEDMWVKTGAQLAAARKMLAALDDLTFRFQDDIADKYDRLLLDAANEACDQARAAGITPSREDK